MRAFPQQIILASASPRRFALLRQIGIDAQALPIDLDESRQPGETPATMVQRLAVAKLRAARCQLGDAARVVIAADTLIELEGEPLGKPRDRSEARAMLLRLSGRAHDVVSAVAMGRSSESVRISRSRVWFHDITAAQADAYWASGEPRDKAGGYAIQGLGAVFVRRIEGSYSGIMGLPLYETAAMLAEIGIDVLEIEDGSG